MGNLSRFYEAKYSGASCIQICSPEVSLSELLIGPDCDYFFLAN